MAHQLDFQITIESNSARELLDIEKALTEVSSYHGFSQKLTLKKVLAQVIGISIHSLDINWDDEVPLDVEVAAAESHSDPEHPLPS